jgi:hypothetical protein
VWRRVAAGLLGLLLVATAWAVFGPHMVVGRGGSDVPREPPAAGGGSPKASAPVPALVPSVAVVPSAAVSSAAVGYVDAGSVYSFMLPTNLVLDWAPYTSPDPATQRLATQFTDVFEAITEAWVFGDTADPRYRAWCVATCVVAWDAVIGPWASARLAPIGTLRLWHESALIGRNGTTGVVEVCMDTAGLSAMNESLDTVSAPVPGSTTLYLFALEWVAPAGRWIAIATYSAPGSAVCTGGGGS